jgi:hypothetical protein
MLSAMLVHPLTETRRPALTHTLASTRSADGTAVSIAGTAVTPENTSNAASPRRRFICTLLPPPQCIVPSQRGGRARTLNIDAAADAAAAEKS